MCCFLILLIQVIFAEVVSAHKELQELLEEEISLALVHSGSAVDAVKALRKHEHLLAKRSLFKAVARLALQMSRFYFLLLVPICPNLFPAFVIICVATSRLFLTVRPRTAPPHELQKMYSSCSFFWRGSTQQTAKSASGLRTWMKTNLKHLDFPRLPRHLDVLLDFKIFQVFLGARPCTRAS